MNEQTPRFGYSREWITSKVMGVEPPEERTNDLGL
jgi:hypothetical protein